MRLVAIRNSLLTPHRQLKSGFPPRLCFASRKEETIMADRSRTSMTVPTTGRVLNFEQTPATPLLDHWPAEEIHPDFTARTAIWRDQRAGMISLVEAQRRSALVGQVRAEPPLRRNAPPRPRHTRPAPNDSRQYARSMATTAARDDCLTPNAKALLVVLRARCGKGRETTITKGTAGAVMSRSPRTIRRYLVDLVGFGYVELETRCNARGLHLGLTVKLTDFVMPFYEEAKGLARWLAETPAARFRPFDAVFSEKSGVTLLSLRNQSKKNLLLEAKTVRGNQMRREPKPYT